MDWLSSLVVLFLDRDFYLFPAVWADVSRLGEEVSHFAAYGRGELVQCCECKVATSEHRRERNRADT